MLDPTEWNLVLRAIVPTSHAKKVVAENAVLKEEKKGLLKEIVVLKQRLEKSDEKIAQLQQSIIDIAAQKAAAGIQKSRPVVSKKKKDKRIQRDTSPDSSVSDASDSGSSSSSGSSDKGKKELIRSFFDNLDVKKKKKNKNKKSKHMPKKARR